MSYRPSWWLTILKLYWPLNHLTARATSLPVIGRFFTWIIMPLFSAKNFNITYIPLNIEIKPQQSTILTISIIENLIFKSSHRAVIKKCSCRDIKKCTEYPIEDSCLLLGEDTIEIVPSIANHLSIDEAIKHLHDKVDLGLIPMTGRVRMDDLYYGIPNRGRMLTICFCCPCFCTVLNSARYFPDVFRSSIVKLEGLRVTTDNNICKRCGKCIEACFLKAITLKDNMIIHDDALCIGCGRCGSVCPEKATILTVDNPEDSARKILNRISNLIKID